MTRDGVLSDFCEVGPTDPPLSADAPFVPMDACVLGHQFPARWEQSNGRTGVRARADDLLFARITPSLENGKVSRVPRDWPRVGGSTEFLVVRPGRDVEPEYLYYWSLSPEVRTTAAARMTGTTGRMRLGKSDLAAIPMRLPDRVEQRRIVDILEGHLSRLDAAEDYFTSVERHASVLQGALLRQSLSDISAPSIALGDAKIAAGYGTSQKCSVSGEGAPVIRIPNVAGGEIDMANTKYVLDAATDVSSFAVKAGDVLIVRTNGSRSLIGRAAVVPPGLQAAFASYLIRYKFDSRVDPEWVSAMLTTHQVRLRIEALAASSAGQYNLSLAKLDGLRIPVPDRRVQAAILERLSNLREDTARLSRATLIQRDLSAALRWALLHAAFTGQLTGSASDLDRAEELAEAM